MGIRRVVTNLYSPDPPRTRDFYVNVFGFEVGMDMGWVTALMSPSNPTAQIQIFRGDPAHTSEGPHVTIEVDDVDDAHARAVAQGGSIARAIHDEEWGVRRFFVEDPDGTVVNVMSHLPTES
jgi:catechol 2,3-dioxygenase-like lactoylglutathione lyase family enzyme